MHATTRCLAIAALLLGPATLPCLAQDEPLPPHGGSSHADSAAGKNRNTKVGPAGRAKEVDRDVERFEKARAKGEILFDLVMMYRKSERADDALAMCRKIVDLEIPVLERHPESKAAAGKRLMIYAFMADLLREKKDLPGALKCLADGQKKAAEASGVPENMRLHAQIELLKAESRIHQEQGNVDKAAEALQKALSLVDK